ncbi:MAG TPA: TIGR00266 family protein [Polyangiaceae bacterium]|jgi:uncharacterized protein (TIGR00266 family)|nr:TIGR00266 family protein [Polyangiaceae bacterium]
MHYEIQYRPAHALAFAHLQPGESVRAEASAMVSMTPNVAVETQANTGGGLLKSLKRSMLGGESFFTNRFTAVGSPGHVSFAPDLCGDLLVHELTGTQLLIQGSSYVSAPDSVQIDTKFQGFKGFFSGESLFFLSATGYGPVLMNAFGAVETLDLNGELIVDTGHLVAFTSGIEYTVTKAGKGWIQSFLSGEGLVLRMRGQGRVYIQSRNPAEYGRAIGAELPPRRS